MLAETIKNTPAALAAATRLVDGVLSPDWSACAAALQAISLTATARECFGVESAEALDVAGNRRRQIMAAMSQDPDGLFVLTKLAGTGVVWAHPMTVALMDALIAAGVMQSTDKAALVQLSAPVTRPHADVTADDCQKAWSVDAARRDANLWAAKSTAVNAWLDALDLTAKTPEEVQSYCDALLASNDGNPE